MDGVVVNTLKPRKRPGRKPTGPTTIVVSFRLSLEEFHRAYTIAGKGDYPKKGDKLHGSHIATDATKVNAWVKERVLAAMNHANRELQRVPSTQH